MRKNHWSVSKEHATANMKSNCWTRHQPVNMDNVSVACVVNANKMSKMPTDLLKITSLSNDLCRSFSTSPFCLSDSRLVLDTADLYQLFIKNMHAEVSVKISYIIIPDSEI